MPLEKIVRNYYRYLCEGSHEAIIALLDQDISHEFNQGPTLVGTEHFREFLKIKHGHYREDISDLFVWTDLDSQRAAAEFTLRGNYVQTYPGLPTASGQPYQIRVGAFFGFRELKISRLTTYFNFETWLSQISRGSEVPVKYVPKDT